MDHWPAPPGQFSRLYLVTGGESMKSLKTATAAAALGAPVLHYKNRKHQVEITEVYIQVLAPLNPPAPQFV